ncbi:MAG TPA: hypothetical protein VN030_13820 [Cellvibrio sp.]|nr:hypothetical protein [Cellvibrio sp.]
MRIRKLCTERLIIEQGWVEDMRQYKGQYSIEALKNMPEGGSQVFVNITRSKTDKGEAQLVDMLFPADDKNYGISPTPNPDLAASAESKEQVYDREGNALQFADDKSPVTEGDVAKGHMELADEAAKAMEREIDDQLVECDYGAQARKMIHYSAILGTGVLCAPEVEAREQRSWIRGEGGQHISVFKVDKRPVARHVPTWDFFPDLSASTIDECAFVFERSYMSKKALWNMRRIPGVVKESLRKLTEETEGKDTQNFSEHVSALREMSGIIAMTEDTRYEVWRYRGPIKKDVLISVGVVEPDDEVVPKEVDGIIIFCGDQVIKAAINPMESEDWPYSVFCWNKDDNCIFGTGIPRAMRMGQAVINTAWRLMLDNATKSAGPQIVHDDGVKPMDNNYQISPWKIWRKNNPNMKVEDAFRIFTFPSVQNELANIYNLAKAQIDEETNLPMIAQGEQGQVTPTLGGMSMLMNAAGAVRRNQVKHFDDDVTVPIIQRFYDWNMQFNPRDEIKGDMRVFARGTSALLVKEQQSQALFAVLDKYVGSPVLSRFFKDEGLSVLRKAIQSLHVNPDDIIKDVETYEKELREAQEAAQGQEQQQDPRIVAEQMRGENRMRELEMEAQMHAQNNQLAYEIARMKTQGELARLANDRDISIAQLEADLKKAGWKMDLDKSMFTTEVQMKQMEGLTANYGLNN